MSLLIRVLHAPWPAVALAAALLFIAPATSAEVLDNQSIVKLHRMGLGSGVILESMDGAETNFDVGVEGLAGLKRDGIPDDVIAAMIRMTKKEKAAVAAASVDFNDPATRHAPGIYVLEDHEGAPRMTRVEASAFSQSKSGGFLANAVSFGVAKVKQRGVLSGERSARRIADPSPTFYFYFDVKEASLSNSAFSAAYDATSPNEFALIELKATKGGREVVISESNSFGSKSGTMSGIARAFTFEQVQEGVYSVTPSPALPAGEYCFYMSGAATGGEVAKVFDFGIDGGAPVPMESAREEEDASASGDSTPRRSRRVGR